MADANGTDYTIEHEEGETKGRYVVRSGDGELGELTYSRAGEKVLIVDHVGVDSSLRGRGVGLELSVLAVEEARAAGREIIPLCPYFKSQFGKHPEWKDVVRS